MKTQFRTDNVRPNGHTLPEIPMNTPKCQSSGSLNASVCNAVTFQNTAPPTCTPINPHLTGTVHGKYAKKKLLGPAVTMKMSSGM